MKKSDIISMTKKPMFWYVFIPLFFLLIIAPIFSSITVYERNNPLYKVDINGKHAVVINNVTIEQPNVTIKSKYFSYPVKVIMYSSFSRNKYLEQIHISPTVMLISAESFSKNENLTAVYLTSAIPPIIENGVFENNNINFQLKIPKEFMNTYIDYCNSNKDGWTVERLEQMDFI